MKGADMKINEEYFSSLIESIGAYDPERAGALSQICTLVSDDRLVITDEYASRLNEYFKPQAPVSAEQYELAADKSGAGRTVLLLHICEGMSLTEISALLDSELARVEQQFALAKRRVLYAIR